MGDACHEDRNRLGARSRGADVGARQPSLIGPTTYHLVVSLISAGPTSIASTWHTGVPRSNHERRTQASQNPHGRVRPDGQRWSLRLRPPAHGTPRRPALRDGAHWHTAPHGCHAPPT